MLGIFKKKNVDLDMHSFERWETKFGLLQQKRFQNESGEGYKAYINKKAYWIELQKKNVFAWVIDNYFKYSDFVINSEIFFDENNGHSAIGFILRYINNENFYSFLIAKNGTFRFDVLFNGNPFHLIEWTKSPFINPLHNEIMVVARGAHFSFYVDNDWVAELEDDTLNMGRVGLAAQNYNQKAKALFKINTFSIDARSLEVEKAYYRWANYIPVDPCQRIVYAKTLFAIENYQGAAVQLKKAFKHKKPTADEYFLFAECLLNLELYGDALGEVDKCLQLNPNHSQARLEKANLLYLLNRFIEGRDFIKEIIEHYPDNAVLLNVLGNCEYSLGNFDLALTQYKKAVSLNPEISLFHMNAARSAEKIRDADQALRMYLEAARLAFKQENYQDLSIIVPRITALDPKNKEVMSIQAKMLYHEDKKAEAKIIFQKLINENYVDSTIFFLYSLLLIEDGKRDEAYSYLKKVVELETEYPLYWFKLAENEYILGKDPGQALKKAYALDNKDIWINNLYGLYYSDKNKLEKAEEYLTRAYAGAQTEIDIIINLSDVLFRLGKKQQAYELIENRLKEIGNKAKLLNHKANLFSWEGKYDEAAAEYEKALALEPDSSVIMENCAAACIESDQIMRANELLVRLVDSDPSASVYNKLGNVALIRGEYKRAELCYKEGLALEPDNQDIKINLATLYGDRLEYKKAKQLLEEVLAAYPKEKRAKKLFLRLQGSFEKKLQCASCSREWWVPKEIPPQEALKVYGDPPHESPAGKCNICGKIFCIGCAKEHMKEKRFICPDCQEALKLSDDNLRYLVRQYVSDS
jgi:tetratricopeptide (TPR) repeat protein